MRQGNIKHIGLIVLMFLAVTTPTVWGQTAETDSLRKILDNIPLPDTQTVSDSTMIEVELPVVYPDFYETNPLPFDSFTGVRHEIDLSGSRRRIYYSLSDALRPMASFYSLKLGPFGQSYGITYLGLPSYLCSISPNPGGSYDVYQFPPTGTYDLRLVGLERFDKLLVEVDNPVTSTASVSAYNDAYNEKNALSEVSTHWGDFSYSNTNVLFKQNVDRRFGWGFTVGIEKSDGYRTFSRKERENYNLDLHYKLTPRWQLNSHIRFMNADDQLSQLGRLETFTSTREDRFRGAEIFAVSGDSIGGCKELFISWQQFQEKIRASTLFLRQRHDSFRFGGKIVKDMGAHRLFVIPHVAFNRATFDPGYEDYMRINVHGGVNLFQDRRISWLLTGRYLFDYGDRSRIGGGARMNFEATEKLSSWVSGDVANIAPADMARFLKSRNFDLNRDGTIEYNHGGDPSLKPTTMSSVSGGFEFGSESYNLTTFGKAARISDMVIWQSYEDSQCGRYQSEAHDADLYALCASGLASFLGSIDVKTSYTYTRLLEKDTDNNLSLMPRHNLYGSISWKQHVRKLRLEFFPSIEAEYHSENLHSYLNPVNLGAYYLLHGKLSVRIKGFTFYYTMENIFNSTHRTVFGYPSNRAVWWGFRWIFIN